MKIFSDIVKDYTGTVGERNEVDDTIVTLLFTQAILGQQVLNPKWQWRTATYRNIFIVLLIIYVLFGTADVLKKETNVTIKAEGYYTLLVTAISLIKYLIFVNNRENFRKAYLIAKSTLFLIIKSVSLEKSIDLINKIKIILRIFYATVLVPIFIYILTAIWLNMHGERVTLSKTTSILMPMTTPYYEIGFILHAMFLKLTAFTFCVIDLWFVILMFFFCVTCDCLVILLQVNSQTAGKSNLIYAKSLNDRLKMFYSYHETLMQYLNILSEMYKWAAVIPLISALFAFCLLLLSIGEQLEWTFFANILPTIAEIFAYNWFGEQIKHKATELKKALLEYDWLNMKLADKKNYLIIATYMTKEFSIRTAFGNELSLNTMTDVLKASYQVFTLMKTMDV